LLPVLGRPIATLLLRRLAQAGVTGAVVNLHHRPEILRRVLGDGTSFGLSELHFSHEEELLGTGGGVAHARPFLEGDEPVLISNADYLADIDIRAAVATHLRSGHLATLVLIPAREGYGRIDVDAEGRILSLAGKPEVPADRIAERRSFAGLHILDPAVLERLPTRRGSCLVRDLHRALAEEGRLGSWLHTGFWWEFGSPELYLEGSLRLMDSPTERILAVCGVHDPLRRVGTAIVATGPGADSDGDAELHGRVALGFASHISAGARLEDVIVLGESWIGPGCRLQRVVVGPGVEVPAGTSLENVLVCADPDPSAPLPPAIRRSDGLLVRELERLTP
jgi:NDP-sugar pyrophosphorylase family protein